MPVLENVYLQLDNGALTLRGNNLEIGIENNIAIDQSIQNGKVLLKAKTLSGIISKIDNEFITLKADDQQKVSIKSGKIDMDILGTKVDEYPVFPSIETGQQLAVRLKYGNLLHLLLFHTMKQNSF